MELQKKLQSVLHNIPEVEFGYLFGSYATKEATSRSDVDVALYLKQDDFNSKLAIHHELQKALHKEIDLVVLNRIKNFDLLQDILDKGVVVKESTDDRRVMFELAKEHEIKDYAVFKKVNDVA